MSQVDRDFLTFGATASIVFVAIMIAAHVIYHIQT